MTLVSILKLSISPKRSKAMAHWSRSCQMQMERPRSQDHGNTARPWLMQGGQCTPGLELLGDLALASPICGFAIAIPGCGSKKLPFVWPLKNKDQHLRYPISLILSHALLPLRVSAGWVRLGDSLECGEKTRPKSCSLGSGGTGSHPILCTTQASALTLRCWGPSLCWCHSRKPIDSQVRQRAAC